jgi:hypothetical protein
MAADVLVSDFAQAGHTCSLTVVSNAAWCAVLCLDILLHAVLC